MEKVREATPAVGIETAALPRCVHTKVGDAPSCDKPGACKAGLVMVNSLDIPARFMGLCAMFLSFLLRLNTV